MKTQFKYAFYEGLHIRGVTFLILVSMYLAFIIPGSLGLLPMPAQITAVSVGVVGIALMAVINIINNVYILRRMVTPPGAFLYALTPVPRWKTLLSSILMVTIMDIVTLTVVIIGEVWLALNLAGVKFWGILSGVSIQGSDIFIALGFITMIIVGYLLVIMIIMFAITAKKSFLFKLPASGFLALLISFACVYVVSLLPLALLPFGSLSYIDRYGPFIMITAGTKLIPVYVLLLLLAATGLFAATSKLMERKMNL